MIGSFCLAGAAGIASWSSCYTQGETTCDQEGSPLAPLRGKVTGEALVRDDAGNPVRDDAGDVIPIYVTDPAGNPIKDPGGNPIIQRVPQANTTVVVELCGIYTGNPDPSKGHPNYRHGTVTRDDGTFEVMVPRGKVGIHTFKDGWFYGRTEVEDSTQPVPEFTELAARKSKAPVLSNFTVTPLEARPGQELAFTVETRAALPDPMSEEVVVIDMTTHAARAFTPPRRGVPKKGWPDGKWTAAMPAPSAPGRYSYIAHSTSEHCVSSNRLTVEVVVR